MIDDVGDIAQYYNDNLDMEDERLVRHQLEYDLTWRYLETYLPASGKVLEIGAATGRYTLELARRGFSVTAVDMSQTLLERAKQRISNSGLADQVRFHLADARDLSEIKLRDFDAILIMGPLYHLTEEADRIQALKEAVDHLKPGGVIFTAFISRFGIFGDLIKKLPHWIEEQEKVNSIIEHGKQADWDRGEGFRGFFAVQSEIAPLHEKVGLETVALAGVEPGISADDESYNQLEGERRRLWLDLLFKVSQERSTIGASRHLLFVGRKI